MFCDQVWKIGLWSQARVRFYHFLSLLSGSNEGRFTQAQVEQTLHPDLNGLASNTVYIHKSESKIFHHVFSLGTLKI